MASTSSTPSEAAIGVRSAVISRAQMSRVISCRVRSSPPCALLIRARQMIATHAGVSFSFARVAKESNGFCKRERQTSLYSLKPKPYSRLSFVYNLGLRPLTKGWLVDENRFPLPIMFSAPAIKRMPHITRRQVFVFSSSHEDNCFLLQLSPPLIAVLITVIVPIVIRSLGCTLSTLQPMTVAVLYFSRSFM